MEGFIERYATFSSFSERDPESWWYLSLGGGCGPVVRLLGCHARARRSVPHSRESGISCGATLVDMAKTTLDIGYCRHGDVVQPQFSHSGST